MQRSTRSLSFRSGMSTLIDTARSAVFRDGQILISLDERREDAVPGRGESRIAQGTPEQLNNIEILPFGLHWPDLDGGRHRPGRLRTEPNQAVERMTTRCHAGLLAQLSRRRAFIAPL